MMAQPSALAQYSQSYDYYIERAESALNRKDFNSAIKYFKQAHLVEPSAPYPLKKIQAIKDAIYRYGDYDDRDAERQLKIYERYLHIGKEALEVGDYSKALYYFRYANQINPDGKEAGQYINLIKRLGDERVLGVDRSMKILKFDKAENKSKAQAVAQALDVIEHRSSPKSEKYFEKSREQDKPAKNQKVTLRDQSLPKNFEGVKTLTLDDRLWATQPKTDLRIYYKSYLILESRDIDRFLIITPGVIAVECIGRDHVKIIAGNIGTTYLHLWDSRGRWTFNVQVVLPAQLMKKEPQQLTDEQYADPFKFSYSLDAGTVHRGPSIPLARRESTYRQQRIATYGQTPYGALDDSVGYTKFAQSTEATSQTIGLSGAKVGSFTDINIRGYDASKYFSALTLPGQYFRGLLVEGKAIGEKIGAVYVHGQDRYTYSFVSPGVVEERRSYIEGTKVTLFPNQDNQYSFNYARGYGMAREKFLKNEVYSLEAKRRFGKMLSAGEIATNHDTLAKTLTSKFGGDHRKFRANFRDIDKDFTTVTSFPSNQGEIGGMLGMDLDYERFDVSSDLDFYRNRLSPNVDDPDALNYDFDTSLAVPINDTTGFASTVYYLNTPGELSPRRNFRLVNNLSKKYKILGERDLNTYVGGTYQRSRVVLTPISDYDRYSTIAGFQLSLIKRLSYFASYEYSWVNELMTDTVITPSVFNTGLNYSIALNRRFSSNVGFYYRDEQNTEGTNSFLAGEDSITGSLGVSYRPTDTSEVFMDTRARNVWKEREGNPAYNEIDVRWGLRSSWELPLAWNPSGIIHGYVFKDTNANAKKDDGESGIPNVHVKIGKKEVVSDANGRYQVKVRAKKILATPDLSTVPHGYVLTTPAVLEIKIPNARPVDFGFSTESGIYGVVFFDHNGNNQPDDGDEFIQKTKIILDNKITESSGYDGTYFFKNVSSGAHNLRLDINSLPIEYLPLVKVTNSLEITEGTTYVFHIPLKKKSSE